MVYIYHMLFIHTFIDGHLHCFHILAIVNNAVMNVRVHISFWTRVFIFFEDIPRSEIHRLYGSSQRRQWQPTPVLLPGKSHGWRNLVGCSPWGRKESETTERLHFHFSLSCIGEGNGNPLQYSWLENPTDGGAWRASLCGRRVGHDWTTEHACTFTPAKGTRLPTEGRSLCVQCEPRDGVTLSLRKKKSMIFTAGEQTWR